MQELSGLRTELFILPEMFWRQLLDLLQAELLQVTHPRHKTEAAQKRPASAAILYRITPAMNPENTLSALLQNWNPLLEPDADFNRAVWARIKKSEIRRTNGFASLFSWIQLMSHPRIAIAAAAIALFSGVLIGNFQAQSSQEKLYLLSLNPYAQR